MWENFKESEFGKRMIKVFSNRGVIITSVLVVMVLTIAIFPFCYNSEFRLGTTMNYHY